MSVCPVFGQFEREIDDGRVSISDSSRRAAFVHSREYTTSESVGVRQLFLIFHKNFTSISTEKLTVRAECVESVIEMTDQNHRTDHLLSRRSAMQLLTAVAGAGAFSGAAAADEDEETESDSEEGDEERPDRPVGTRELLDYLGARYGDQLADADLDELADDVAGNVRRAQALDGVELENGDDMALTFRAYRGSY